MLSWVSNWWGGISLVQIWLSSVGFWGSETVWGGICCGKVENGVLGWGIWDKLGGGGIWLGITGILWDECGIFHHRSGIFGNDNRIGIYGGLAIGFWGCGKGCGKGSGRVGFTAGWGCGKVVVNI